MKASSADTHVDLVFGSPLLPGMSYVIEAIARDASGNCLNFLSRVPRLAINEFTTQGSGKHPDLVEIAVLSSGSLAGVCLQVGSRSDWDARLIFPDVTVKAGDYAVV